MYQLAQIATIWTQNLAYCNNVEIEDRKRTKGKEDKSV